MASHLIEATKSPSASRHHRQHCYSCSCCQLYPRLRPDLYSSAQPPYSPPAAAVHSPASPATGSTAAPGTGSTAAPGTGRTAAPGTGRTAASGPGHSAVSSAATPTKGPVAATTIVPSPTPVPAKTDVVKSVTYEWAPPGINQSLVYYIIYFDILYYNIYYI